MTEETKKIRKPRVARTSNSILREAKERKLKEVKKLCDRAIELAAAAENASALHSAAVIELEQIELALGEGA